MKILITIIAVVAVYIFATAVFSGGGDGRWTKRTLSLQNIALV